MQALRQREEALLSVQALRDESETKADAVAQLEAEGSKVLPQPVTCTHLCVPAQVRVMVHTPRCRLGGQQECRCTEATGAVALALPCCLLAASHALLLLATQTYGTHYGKTRKAAALSEEVRALQEAGIAAQAEYERVRDRNLEVGAAVLCQPCPQRCSRRAVPKRAWGVGLLSAVAVDQECG